MEIRRIRYSIFCVLSTLAGAGCEAEVFFPFPVPPAEALVAPRAVAASGGRVFVLDGEGWIRFFDYEGRRVGGKHLVKTARGFPAGVAVESPETILIADAHESRILRLDREGERVAAFGGGLGSAPGQFVYPQRFAFRDGEIFVSEYGYGPNNRVQVFGSDGTFKRTFGEFGKVGAAFSRPEGVAIGVDGTVYVADASHRILAWTPAGEYLCDISSEGDAPGRLRYPFGLVFDAGWLYVVEYGNNRISRFRENGEYGGSYGEQGSRTGQFLSPRDLAVADGLLFVADTGNNRVVRLDLDRVPFKGADR